MTSQNLRKSVLCVAMGMCLVAMASSAYAANNDGSGRWDARILERR